LRIQTLSENEKWEMGQVDAFARRILERTEALTDDQFRSMHGVMHPVRSASRDPFQPPPQSTGSEDLPDACATELDLFSRSAGLDRVAIGGVILKPGDRVRIRPRTRADIMDLALQGKTAVIEAIEEDAEARVHLALVVEDDPGKDLGFERQPG